MDTPKLSFDFDLPTGPPSRPSSNRSISASRIRFGTSRTLDADENARRKSIQFNVGAAERPLPRRTESAKGRVPQHVESEKEHKAGGGGGGGGGRTSSPPPPKTYERGVSFDTFDNRDAPDFSLTLNYKHKGFQWTRRSRTFLCGIDQNDYSEYALEWLIDELVDDGDEIVCLRAVEKDSSITTDAALEARKYREEAENLFKQVIRKNSQDEKAISLVLELAVGKVQDIIQRMIRIYEPAVLIVGTRGRNMSGMQSLLPGSVSKYCLQQSPIPVIVVRPSPKREKKKKKRQADPTRRGYNHILEMSERRGSSIFDARSSTDSNISRLPDEEAAVAEALGLPRDYTHSRSSLSTTETVSDTSSISLGNEEADFAPAGSTWNSLDAIMMDPIFDNSAELRAVLTATDEPDSESTIKPSSSEESGTGTDQVGLATEGEERVIPVIITEDSK
ncbi:hypothetical protein ASPZODRAFT_96841 [Penicilliopsis zonata CBS 506.65]|uniref:UspA domain-containing protein n=1 Tax=Penicilliopsis zonata CBS 506.65 TaxID=1073090 RepID=A0A1L9SH80_9EURO|nr:hypothetical protein ASPZODRAFT_96841 [Penicilliopsis zonata CBS 506.65]OJJ46562.1 hypothetical protein ASPZODRAFT_96841 [Penicilliopsis zonata CBS 506.65]